MEEVKQKGHGAHTRAAYTNPKREVTIVKGRGGGKSQAIQEWVSEKTAEHFEKTGEPLNIHRVRPQSADQPVEVDFIEVSKRRLPENNDS